VKFSEVIEQASALLQRRGRITYRSLKREFELEDEGLEDLKAELLYSHPQVVEDEGRGLRWTGALPVSSSTPQEESFKFQVQGSKSELRTADPGHWTPPHLAERILVNSPKSKV